MPSRYRSGGLGKANLFDTNVKATQIDRDIFTDQEVLTSIADNDLVLLLDVSEDPDEIKYMTKANLIAGLTALTGSTDNTLVTVTGANAIAGEANLLFDGTILTNDGGEIDIDISSGDPHLSFQIGGTDEFTIGVDDSDSDIFKIDTGGTVGGATKLSIDTSGNVIIAGGLTTGSTSFVNSSGVIQVASQTNITGVGTISTGTWQGTAIASAYLDSDTAHLTGTQTFSGVKTFSSGFARGSDAEGDILYSNGTAYVRLARGSDDQVLTLASGVPSWATPTTGDITGVTAGVGLSGGGTTGGVTLTLDLSELSDVTPVNGDKLATLDSDGANEQLTTVASLATLFAGTGLTASSSVIGVDASQAITALTGGDLTIYEDANNADVSLKMGTSATESLSIEVLNGGSNKTAEEIRITTATASATANHGKIAIYIDGAEILDIDDGGIDMASGMTVALNGTDIVSSPITALNSATANELVTVGSTTTELDAEANLTFGSDILALTSSSASLPRIDLTNTHAGATSPVIRFNKDSSSGDDNDVMGRIEFYGTDAGENTHQELAYIDSYIIDSAHGSEASGIRFYVAENDATLTLGLQILGQADDDSEVDVILGAGAASTTTIAGTLTMGSTAALTNAGLVAVANQSNITGVGTISSGTWQGTAIASAYLDSDTAHLSGTQTFSGAKTFTSTITVGVDDTGHDVKFFGASAGAYMLYDQSEDQLVVMGASADATTSTGKLLLATSLTDINANDVIGKIDFQAPHEGGGTDAITVAASIQAIAQGTFSASVNATDLVFYTGHSEAATEKFRFTSQGEIGIGGANYGTDGQVLTSGGAGAAPAWEDAGGGGGTQDFEADGAISDGALVSIKTDGTVEAVANAAYTFGNVSPRHEMADHSASRLRSALDTTTNQIVFVWENDDDSDAATSCVGRIVGDGMVFGDLVEFTSNAINPHNMCYDSNTDRVVVSYRDGGNSSYGTAVVGTIDGLRITWGTPVVYDSGYTADAGVVFDSNSNKVVIGFRNYGGDGDAKGIVGTVSGTAISFGSASSAFESGTTYYMTGTFDSNSNKVIFAFNDENNSQYGTAVVGTVSSTDVTFGSQAVFESARVDWVSCTFDSDLNKVVISYHDSGNSGYGTAVVGTVSGTGISFGTPVVFASQNTQRVESTYDTDINKVIITYSDAGSGGELHGTIGTVSGTSISFSADQTLDSGSYNIYPTVQYVAEYDKIVIGHANGNATTGRVSAMVTEAFSLGVTNYVGIAKAAISDGATGTVNIVGSVDDSQSSLTVGSVYYLQDNATISTTYKKGREIGRALSATNLLLTNGSIQT